MLELCIMDISGVQRVRKRTAICMTKMMGVNPAGTKSACWSCQRDLHVPCTTKQVELLGRTKREKMKTQMSHIHNIIHDNKKSDDPEEEGVSMYFKPWTPNGKALVKILI